MSSITDNNYQSDHHCVLNQLYMYDNGYVPLLTINVSGEARLINICSSDLTLFVYDMDGLVDKKNRFTLQTFQVESIKKSIRNLTCVRDTCQGERLLQVYFRDGTAKPRLALKFCKVCSTLFKINEQREVEEFIF